MIFPSAPLSSSSTPSTQYIPFSLSLLFSFSFNKKENTNNVVKHNN